MAVITIAGCVVSLFAERVMDYVQGSQWYGRYWGNTLAGPRFHCHNVEYCQCIQLSASKSVEQAG
jgi:predicted N-acyltransferase